MKQSILLTNNGVEIGSNVVVEFTKCDASLCSVEIIIVTSSKEG